MENKEKVTLDNMRMKNSKGKGSGKDFSRTDYWQSVWLIQLVECVTRSHGCCKETKIRLSIDFSIAN